MHRRIRTFWGASVPLVWLLGTQFLLLPFYHFHPDSLHIHSGKLFEHQHNAYFHSIELDSIAHITHSHDHSLEADHRHSNHSGGQNEDHLKIEFNKETLKTKNIFEVLKVSVNFSSTNFHKQLKNYSLPLKLNDFTNFFFQPQLRERSPPSLSI